MSSIRLGVGRGAACSYGRSIAFDGDSGCSVEVGEERGVVGSREVGAEVFAGVTVGEVAAEETLDGFGAVVGGGAVAYLAGDASVFAYGAADAEVEGVDHFAILLHFFAFQSDIGDPTLAATFMRPEGPLAAIIQSKSAAQELLVQLRGYVIEPVRETEAEGQDPHSDAQVMELEEAAEGKAYDSMADHLFKALRGSNNLLFPNSRNRVEYFSDLLRRRCEREGIPNEFWPHHGSLSREIREDTEAALKAGNRPATAICTTTLELGIDIGSVKSVAQIGPPPSVAALRQRLGRSGRRPGEPASHWTPRTINV